jgi:hypothetical protein
MGSRAPRVAAWTDATAAGRPAGCPAAGVPLWRGPQEKHFPRSAYPEVSSGPIAEPIDLQGVCEGRRARRGVLRRVVGPRLTAR